MPKGDVIAFVGLWNDLVLAINRDVKGLKHAIDVHTIEDAITGSAIDSLVKNNRIANTLRTEAETALQSAVEFQYEPFAAPFLDALSDATGDKEFKGAVSISRLSKPPALVINGDAIWGSLDEYVAAVRKVRESRSKGGSPGQRSAQWKRYYKAAREGRQMFTWRTGGFKGSDRYTAKDRTAEYALIYQDTIAARISACKSPAPWWSLLNDGNASVKELGTGGTPYPTNRPTRFIQRTEEKLVEFMAQERALHDEKLQRMLVQQQYILELQRKVRSLISGQASVTDFEGWDPLYKQIKLGQDNFELYVRRYGRYGKRVGIR
jgi:hypothetical protein